MVSWRISAPAYGSKRAASRNGPGVSRDDHSSVNLKSGASPAHSHTICTEPKLADQEWLSQIVGRRLGRTCRITEAAQIGASAQGRSVALYLEAVTCAQAL